MQFPILDDAKKFEELTRDVFRIIYNDPTFDLYGRTGQKQEGMDGYKCVNGKYVIFQCKLKHLQYRTDDTLVKKLQEEMEEEALKTINFIGSPDQIEKFVFATTYKADTHLQDHAQALSKKLNFPIEYWSWERYEDMLNKNELLQSEYYPQYQPYSITKIQNTIYHISKDFIAQRIITDQQNKKKLEEKYYKINDADRTVMDVVFNDIDIENTKLVGDIKHHIDQDKSNSAYWIVGDGGMGKTTLSIRLAKHYALEDKAVFWINFEQLNSIEHIHDLFAYIKIKAKDQKAYIFIDNPDANRTALENILHNIPDQIYDFILVFIERKIRLKRLKDDHVQYYINGQIEIPPYTIQQDENHRKAVYDKLFDIIGGNNQTSKDIIEKYRQNKDLSFVETTYKIFYELKQKQLISYVFDWEEFENIAQKDFPTYQNTYQYIALLYLFAIKTPLSLLDNIVKPSDQDRDALLTFLQMTEREPIILETKNQSISFNSLSASTSFPFF